MPPLAPLRVPPPAVVLANAACAVAAAVVLLPAGTCSRRLLLQPKTVLDNADGQLARTTGQISALGRYLDSLCDLRHERDRSSPHSASRPATRGWRSRRTSR